MGVNIPNVCFVIHVGQSGTIDNYVQELGRAGRDGNPSHAVIYLYPGALRGNIEKEMKQYCWNEGRECRRQFLFQSYPGKLAMVGVLHDCCDVCCIRCACGECSQSLPRCVVKVKKTVSAVNVTDSEASERQDTVLHPETLWSSLKAFQMTQNLIYADEKIPIQPELVTGINEKLIDAIVCHSPQITTLCRLCQVWGNEEEIWEIITKVRSDSITLRESEDHDT